VHVATAKEAIPIHMKQAGSGQKCPHSHKEPMRGFVDNTKGARMCVVSSPSTRSNHEACSQEKMITSLVLAFASGRTQSLEEGASVPYLAKNFMWKSLKT
jgi:hypothetical protein